RIDFRRSRRLFGYRASRALEDFLGVADRPSHQRLASMLQCSVSEFSSYANNHVVQEATLADAGDRPAICIRFEAGGDKGIHQRWQSQLVDADSFLFGQQAGIA